MPIHGKVKKEAPNLQEKKLSDAEKLEVREFLLGDPVCRVSSGVIKADQGGTAIENAKKWAKDHTQNITRQDIGKVVFDAGGVKDMDDLKNTAIPFQTPGADLTARPQRGIAIYLNLLRNILNVKGDF